MWTTDLFSFQSFDMLLRNVVEKGFLPLAFVFVFEFIISLCGFYVLCELLFTCIHV